MADDVKKYSKRLDKQRERGLRYSLNAVDSLYANLSATQKGLARTLTNENSRTLSKLAAMSSRIAAQSVRAVDGASSGMVGKYGALYGGQVAQKMEVAGATTEAIGAAGVAALQTGKGLMRAGNEAMAIQMAGVEDAKAAAQYALAQASIARAQADADAVAALEAQRAAAGLNDSSPGLTSVANLAANISKALRRKIAEAVNSGEPVNLLAVATAVSGELGIDPQDTGQMSLVRYLAQAIYSQNLWNGTEETARMKGGKGTGRQDEIQAILDAVAMAYAGNVSEKDLMRLRTVVAEYLTKIYPKPADTTLPPGDRPDSTFDPQPPSPPDKSDWTSPTPVQRDYEENVAAGIELYIMQNPKASRDEAERAVRQVLSAAAMYPWAAAAAPDYVGELRRWKQQHSN